MLFRSRFVFNCRFSGFYWSCRILLLDLGAQTHIERQLLLLFIIPLIPLFLSAVRHNIEINVQKYRDIQSYDRNYRRDIFPLSALKYFQRSF